MIQDEFKRVVEQHTAIDCIYKDFEGLFSSAPGSGANHHAWEGGYIDHVRECMRIAESMYEGLSNVRPLPFMLEDALVVLRLHDIEKPFRYFWQHTGYPVYRIPPVGDFEFSSFGFLDGKDDRKAFRQYLIAAYGIRLTADQWNAMEYIEGEMDYSPKERKMDRMAAFCHAVDVLSARMWWDEPARGAESTV